jgi:hypothetical protein
MAVSSTSVKGFKPYKSLVGVDMPNQLLFILENSATVTVGDAIRLDTNGCVKRCASTDPAVLGIVTGIYDQNGQLGVFSPRIPGTAIAGATLTPDDTITTASDNRTNTLKQLSVYIHMDINGDILYQNNANNTGLTQSNVGQFYNVVSSNAGQIDTASNSSTSGQFQLVSLNPDGDGVTSKALFRIVQSQFLTGFNGYGTNAVITA